MSNMSYCMFENTSNDMQDIIDKMHEDDFHPDQLSRTERKAFDIMYDQCNTMIGRLDELEEISSRPLDADDVEAEAMTEERLEEYEMHAAIVGTKRADEDFSYTQMTENK